MKSKLTFAVMALLATGFIVWSMLYQSGAVGGPAKVPPGAKATPAAAGNWAVLKPEIVPVIYTAVGTVHSREAADIISRLPAARILEIKVRSGDAVKAGDLLVKLESTDLKAAAESAEENLKAARSRLDFAESEFKRNEKLLESNAISRRAYEQALSNLNTARAEVSMLSHVTENARANLSYAELRAPFAGVVAERFNDPGDLATPQKPVLTFFDPVKLQLRLPIREGLVSGLKVGETLNVRIEALNRDLKAEIREIIPSVDPGSRTFAIDACLVGDTAGVMPGMFAVCQLPIGSRTILPVPASAVRRVGQLEYLTVRTPSGPVEQYITTAPYRDGSLEIISGAQAGDEYDPKP
ncbi:MAG: efflux RND transporter periplasmic adaptor subunit [Victivallaceae bacterium]